MKHGNVWIMASEIRSERILGNWKPPRGYARQQHRNSKNYKRRPGMSDAHLNCIRQLSCCVCGAQPRNEAHHLKSTGERGAGVRSTDKHAVPLCPIAIGGCHADVEAIGAKNERKWFLDRGLDALALAEALWAATGNIDQMQRIVEAHKA